MMIRRQVPLCLCYLAASSPPLHTCLGFSFAPLRSAAAQPPANHPRGGAGLARMTSASGGLTDLGRGPSRSGGECTGDDLPVASWRERIATSIARSRKVRGGNYVQIATVDPETGEPRCRTVVFRGFLAGVPDGGDGSVRDGESCVMKMITDLRSAKVGEASAGATAAAASGSANCELVWWFGKSSEQYRVRGDLRFVGGGAFNSDSNALLSRARKEQWGNLSDPAREQFFWRDPSLPYEPQAEVPPGGRDGEGKVLPPPDNFLLMLLYPRRVDYLRLGDNFRQIDEVDGGKWTEKRVNP